MVGVSGINKLGYGVNIVYYIAQAVGIVGLTFAVISFQKNSNKGILFFQVLAELTFFVHFTLLGAYTGAYMNLIGAVRNLVFYNREKRWAQSKNWVFVFIAVYVIIGILTWKNEFSILPIIAMTLSSIALWIKNPKFTRLIVLPSSPCWLIYNIESSSIAGVLTESFVLSSLIIAIIRFDVWKQPQVVKEENKV